MNGGRSERAVECIVDTHCLEVRDTLKSSLRHTLDCQIVSLSIYGMAVPVMFALPG